ncbi:MAG: VWA domain-containing protein [Planctomycetes bacterium]|nr:VWA domain-containing protein [Planctomycetota bacterium]
MPWSRALVGLLLLALPAPAQVEPTGPFDEEARRYEASLQRRALYIRALSAERFALTRDARALRVLMRRYLQPDPPEDHVRYLVAGIAGDAFQGAEHVDGFQDALKRASDAADAWLWLQALRLEARHRGTDGVVAVACDGKRDPFVRAAALHVLSHEDRADAGLAAVQRVLGAPQGARLKAGERLVLTEACAWVLPAARARLGTEAFTTAAGLVIDGLDGKKLELRSRLVVARALARALRSDALYLEAEPWRRLLAGRAAEAQAPAGDAGGTRLRVQGGPGLTSPRFFGIEAAGARVVFVVDLSDSMLQPLAQAELADLRRPRTGAPAGAQDDLDLPWDKIKNRFDLAREVLRRSLLALGDKMSFGVVVFGTKAESLLGPSLVRATPQNVQRAAAALDALRVGKPEAGREHGTLKGYTNLHGGLRLAYRMTERQPIPAHEHVAPAGFDTGCDTIFLLSDGVPSWDDFDAEDIRVEGMTAGDPETGADHGDAEELHYYGPYVEWRFLLRDVERMNLFRRAELHCVGIGEADPELLRELAELGRGELRTIGAPRGPARRR